MTSLDRVPCPLSSPILRRRHVGTHLAGALVGFALTVATGAGALQAADLTGSFRGNAFATFANATAGPVTAQLGRSAYQPCPCAGTNGQVFSNTVNALQAGDDGKVLKADVTLSTVFTQKTTTTATIQDTSTITGLNLLNGLITATRVKAVANVAATASSIDRQPQGRRQLDRRQCRAQHRGQSARPGFGDPEKGPPQRWVHQSGRIVVQMIVVDVAQSNSLGLPVGAQIVVASATSAFSRTEPTAVVRGQAYATLANAKIGNGLQNRIGKAALVTIGCEGTDGQTLTNNISSFNVGSLLTLGNSVTTAFGGPQNGGTVAKTTATIENVSLLGGLIAATTIKAVALETFKNGTRTRSTTRVKGRRLEDRDPGGADQCAPQHRTSPDRPGQGDHQRADRPELGRADQGRWPAHRDRHGQPLGAARRQRDRHRLRRSLRSPILTGRPRPPCGATPILAGASGHRHRRCPRHRRCHLRRYAVEGARVAVADLLLDEANALAAEIGRGAIGVRLDVTKQASIDTAVAEVVAKAGGIDILVKNAGIFAMAPILEITEASFDKQFAVNAKGLLFMLQAGAWR